VTRPTRVAIAGPLSGDRHAYGRIITRIAADFAGHPGMEISLFDDRADPTTAREVALELVKQKFDVVVGHFSSECAMSAKEKYDTAGIPLILPAATAVGLADGILTFSLTADDVAQARRMIGFAASLDGACAHVWSDGSAYALRLLREMSRMPRAYGQFDLGAAADISKILFLGSHTNILRVVRASAAQLRQLALICCDDCFVDEFLQLDHPNCFVCGPKISFTDLLRRALEIVLEIFVRQTAQFTTYFDSGGVANQAGFAMYEVVNGNFVRLPPLGPFSHGDP
jgi:branched-chain amino acid transport system substrate-binding protein